MTDVRQGSLITERSRLNRAPLAERRIARATTVSLPEVPAELIARIARGDARALTLLYDHTIERVFSIAVHIVGDGADADDVCSEVYRQVWERARSYDPTRGGIFGWICVIAHSRALDLRRKRRTRRAQECLHPSGADVTYRSCEADQPFDMLSVIANQSAVHSALACLAAAQRRVIALAFFEGLSHAQIAARTGQALGTVKSHIRRGLVELRKRLSTALAGDG